jgi:hypothetical protein
VSSIAADIAAQVDYIDLIVSCPVTGDPRDASQARDVVVLIDPPTRDYVRILQTWQLVVLRNTTDLGIDTTEAISEVVAELEASPLVMEEAKPGARVLAREKPAVPAYFIRYTTP